MRRKVVRRYSTAFKQKVVSEVEGGELTVGQVQRRYNLGRGSALAAAHLKILRLESTVEPSSG